ncbi:DNA adenine methylase [Gordonia sputi]|uniref:DNA adenine methylase n=1 Tax=Gordonia sputi TaxID=36823 RepID=UPI0022720C28|nr:DNA adenine methylase [Gordonia sputi]
MTQRYLSPLRYPGGKARVAPYLADLIRAQPTRPTVYAEPFAGGAGAALRLLADEVVKTIRINDLSPGVAAFWRAVFEQTDQFARRIETAKVDIAHWHKARAIFDAPESHSDLDLAYATFFLNRCNRSGILNARPIGGFDQSGKWKIDARFNREELASRVRRLGEYRRRVTVTELDARKFIQHLDRLKSPVLAYVDPPYIVQGEDLYLDSLSYEDHAALADELRTVSIPWMLTYDVSEKITHDLYAGLRTAKFDIAHTAQRQHVGSELVVYSDNLEVGSIQLLNGANASWVS